jgi:Uma2 family endonuclease
MWPDHLLTLEEFSELPEDNSRRYELQEGILIVSPRANSLHQWVAFRLMTALDEQLPQGWKAIHDVEVVTQRGVPANLRVPDIVIVREELISAASPRFVADDVLVAVEIVSPGSKTTDTLVKRVEYAKAGIPHYWVIDLDEPLSLVEYHLAGDLGYQVVPAVTGTFETSDPFSLRVDLTELTELSRRPGRGEKSK